MDSRYIGSTDSKTLPDTRSLNRHGYEALLRSITSEVKPLLTEGDLPRYIPQLARVAQDQFGIALATLDGREFVAGKASEPFSIQSISKLFSLILALERAGDDLWRRVGKEPSGTSYNEIVQVDQDEGIPRNPFVNAGALVVTDELCSRFAQPEIALLQALRRTCSDESVNIDTSVARSERNTCYRNAAIAYLLKSFNSIGNDVDLVLDTYCRQCAITMSCLQVARSALPLASSRHANPDRGLGKALSAAQKQTVNALMLTCGTYNAAGEFAARVGLPLKSGVGGGIVAIIPSVGALCAWSPGLDATGNSIAAGRAVELFAKNICIAKFGL